MPGSVFLLPEVPDVNRAAGGTSENLLLSEAGMESLLDAFVRKLPLELSDLHGIAAKRLFGHFSVRSLSNLLQFSLIKSKKIPRTKVAIEFVIQVGCIAFCERTKKFNAGRESKDI